MQEIVMDAANWASPDDVYDSFFEAVGAPSWHGRNFNALRDSIEGGRINRIEVPYLIRIKNASSMKPAARLMLRDFVDLIKSLQASGCSVDVVLED